MATRKSHLRQAVSLMWRTRPFLRVRLAVFSIFFFATIGYFAIVILLLKAGGTETGAGVEYDTVQQIIVLAVALLLYVLGRRYTGHYLAYAGHAPHLYTMVAAMKGEPLPKGNQQIDWATARLEEAYPDTSRFVHLESMVGRGLRQIQKRVVPPGGDQQAARPRSKLTPLFQWLATRYIRGAVVGYAFWIGRPNVYNSARRGLARYAQASDPVARSAVRVFVFGMVIGILLVGLMIGLGFAIPVGQETVADPAAGQALLEDRSLLWWAQKDFLMALVVFAGLAKAGWVLKTALYDPIGQAWMLSVFIRHIDEQPAPNDELIKRLESSSKHFRELGVKAKEFERPGTGDGAVKASEKAKAPEKEKAPEPAKPKAGEAVVQPKPEAPRPAEAATPPKPAGEAQPPRAEAADSTPKIEVHLDDPEPPSKP